MYCGGDHLGFPIGIKNRHLVEDLPMIIPGQFGFNYPSGFREENVLKHFCSDMKFKMAATAGLSLTLDPMGKLFQNASSLKPLGQLKPNCQAFEHFPIGSNVNLCIAVATILDFRSA
jgi:hypothetical protein